MEKFLADGGVVRPVYFVLGAAGVNYELVFGRAAGMLARGHADSAVFRKHAFAVADCFFDEFGFGKSIQDLAGVAKEIFAAYNYFSILRHGSPS